MTMNIIDFILHADKYLELFFSNYGVWIYGILFLIIFCETGLVVTPFLPGDSLLFATGAFAAAQGGLDIQVLYWSLLAAAIIGDTVNYWIGWLTGPKVFSQEKGLWFKKEYLMRTHAFYEKHGGKAIILARFVPIIRTFAPFVAGIGTMQYGKFILYNIAGGVAWITIFLLSGYFLGNIPAVKSNLKLLLVIIIIVSVLPIIFEWWRHKRNA